MSEFKYSNSSSLLLLPSSPSVTSSSSTNSNMNSTNTSNTATMSFKPKKLNLDFPLRNASITSIKIPFIPRANNIARVHEPSGIDYNDTTTYNGVESDLTELSWLTNNVHMFKNSSIGLLAPQPQLFQPIQLHPIQKPIMNTERVNSYGNYTRLLHNRNSNFTYSSPCITKKPNDLHSHNIKSDTDSPESPLSSTSSISPCSSPCSSLNYPLDLNTNNLSSSFSSSLSSSSSSSSSSSTSSTSSKIISSPLVTSSNARKTESKKVNKVKTKSNITKNTKKVDKLSISNIKDEPVVSSSSLSPISQMPFQNQSLENNITYKNNCGLNKPPLTLSCLIFMALQESKDKCLPVRDIYEWIEENFPFYKSVSNAGWKSSIRHNLSFSKCFKKMDRSETVNNKVDLVKEEPNTNELEILNGTRKRRAPNSTGTSWKVNPECKSYLVQMLKKSSFWFHNAKFYPNLSRFINSYSPTNENNNNNNVPVHHSSSDRSKKLKKENNNTKIQDNEFMNQEVDEEIDQDNNIYEFVKKQQENLKFEALIDPVESNESSSTVSSTETGVLNVLAEDQNRQDLSYSSNGNFDPKDLAAAAVLASAHSPAHESNKLDLSLSSSTSSLSTTFSQLSTSNKTFSDKKPLESVTSDQPDDSDNSTIKRRKTTDDSAESSTNLGLNSDLEMEVASTLVGMKFFAARNRIFRD